jgi:MerR family transcriptional regulator/heat shock protein HspR
MKNQKNNTQNHSIGDVAEQLGISVETIRLYERKGLILASKTKGNQRYFSLSDIERIKNIRVAINDYKVSIEGIRRMQALVPCWEHNRCPVKQRRLCPAYRLMVAGCWTYKSKKSRCFENDCRDCKIYLLSGDCERIKSLIYHKATSLKKRKRTSEKR